MKHWFKQVLPAVMLSFGLAACATSDQPTTTAVVEQQQMIKIQGDVFFRERMMLPPHAEITVELKDVSLADAPAVVLAAQTTSPVRGKTEFAFELAETDFKANHRYVIGAKITVDKKLLFINTQAYPIDLNDLQPISVLVQKVGQ